MTTQQLEIDAKNATALILEGFEVEPGSILESKIRQAYLLGRTDQALENYSDVLKFVRRGTLSDNLKDSITLARMGKQ